MSSTKYGAMLADMIEHYQNPTVLEWKVDDMWQLYGNSDIPVLENTISKLEGMERRGEISEDCLDTITKAIEKYI